jgi:hypothetical protein
MRKGGSYSRLLVRKPPQICSSHHYRNIAIDYRQLAYEGMAVLSVVKARMFFMTDLSLHPPCQFLAALGCAQFCAAEN